MVRRLRIKTVHLACFSAFSLGPNMGSLFKLTSFGLFLATKQSFILLELMTLAALLPMSYCSINCVANYYSLYYMTVCIPAALWRQKKCVAHCLLL